jgi:hypothetical protein
MKSFEQGFYFMCKVFEFFSKEETGTILLSQIWFTERENKK